MGSISKSTLVLIPYEMQIFHKNSDKCIVYYFKKEDFDAQGAIKVIVLAEIVRKIQTELKEPQSFLTKALNIRELLYILEGNGGTDSSESTTNLEVTCFLDLHPASSTYEEVSEVDESNYFQSHTDADKLGTWEIITESKALGTAELEGSLINLGKSCAMFTERAFKALKKAILLQNDIE